ncbi:MAG: hypothetical protein Q8O14_14955 [bacterium]|jgi:hypothetical protein|nr:hypothetical protein [bacterium]
MRGFAVSLALTLAGAGLAQGATGLAFLKICPDAASSALGENGAVGWRDALSPVRNPALAPPDELTHLAITRSDWIFESDYLALAFRSSFRTWSWGADLRVLSSDNFELRDGPNPDPTGEFRLDDLAVGLSLSVPLKENLRAGAALRRIQEKMYNENSRGWTGDLGLRWERRREVGRLVAVSATARNLGYSSDFVNEAPDPPRTLGLGAEWQGELPLGGWSGGLQAELRHLQDDGSHLHLGAEAMPVAGLTLRGGWMSGYEERGSTLGVGFAWRNLRLDYAWLPFSSALADVHRFTFSFAL